MKFHLLLFLALIISPTVLVAQSIDDEIALIQSAFGMERRAVIEE